MNQAIVTSTVDRLIAEGQSLVDNAQHIHGAWTTSVVDPTGFAHWLPGCRNLLRLLGEFSEPFNEPFKQNHEFYSLSRAKAMLAALQAIKDAIDHGLLLSLEALVIASAFSDLLEQAEELADKKYLLASGVICRAVFEEHLRKLCDANKCLPAGKPTIDPLGSALVKAGVLTAIDGKQVTLIAAAGNHCAHNNQPPLDEKRIRDLIRGVTDFLARHPLA